MSAAEVMALDALGVATQAVRRLPVNSRRIVTFGDSFDGTGVTTSYGYNILAPANGVAGYHRRRSSSAMAWLMRLSGQQFEYHTGLNFAIGGHNTTEQLLTDNGGAAAVLDTMRPGIAFWEAGTNDGPQGINAATTIANDAAFVALCQARGVECYLVAVAPRGAWSDSPATETANRRRAWIDRINQSRWQMARSLPNVHFVDTWGHWASPSSNLGNPFAGNTQGDALHPSYGQGGYHLGLARWQAMQAAGYRYLPGRANVGADAARVYDPVHNPTGNRLSNPTLSGTSGQPGDANVSGTFPLGWAIKRSSGDVLRAVGSRGPRPDGLPGDAQRVDVTLAGTGGSQGLSVQHGSAIAVTPGDLMQARIGYGVADTVGAMNLLLSVDFADADGTVILTASDGSPHGTMPDGGHHGIAAIDPVTVPAGAATAKLTAYLAMRGEDAANRATLTLFDAWLGRPD